MQKLHYFVLIFLIVLVCSCKREEFPFYDGQGKRPVYIPISELDNITNLSPQPIELTGTIFLIDTLFFMMEQRKGIHVYRIGVDNNPIQLTFLKIPAITGYTINGTVLYADSWKDLVSIDISDIYSIQLLSRTKDMFQPVLFPLLYNGSFECVDESKGAIIDWEDAYLENARCEITN